MPVAEELKLYALGGRRIVFVQSGSAERLREHLGARGFPAGLTRRPGVEFDRLELDRHADPEAAQAALDDWPR
jgi:hypothetical protein